MVYNLIFTIIGLLFMIMLLVSLFFKRRNNSIRSRVFRLLITSSLLYALADIISIYTLVYSFESKTFLRIIWNFRNSCVFVYVIAFLWYYKAATKNYQYKNLFQLFTKNKLFLGSFFYIFAAVSLSTFKGRLPQITPDNISFTTTADVIPVMIFIIIFSFIGFLCSLKYRKTDKKIFNCFLLVFILTICLVPLQLYFHNVSLQPFVSMFLLYVIYHYIENPDILLVEEVSELKTNIDNSSNTKTDFLFNLSYDLVSPLNSLVSLSQVLYDIEVDNDTLINDIYSVKYLGNSLLESIDNILNMSDEKDINNKKYSLVELVNKMNSFAVSKIGSKNISFQVSVNENINSNLIGDFNKINKILMNILSNSVKYTDVGKIIFDVNFSVSKDNNIILNFKISDTGCGIKDEEKSFVFSDDSSFKSGYGLAISKKYIEAMNGNIRFESSYGAGTTFYIDIPQGIYDNILYRDVVSNDVGDGDVLDFSNRKIMIVDDDKLDIKVTRRYLKKYGVDVIGITNSIECVNRLKGYEEFDMLLVDHMMPVMNGVEILNVVKSLEGYKIPVMICLTANVIDGAREYYKNLGFDDYLAKPIDKKDFDKIIKRYLK